MTVTYEQCLYPETVGEVCPATGQSAVDLDETKAILLTFTVEDTTVQTETTTPLAPFVRVVVDRKGEH